LIQVLYRRKHQKYEIIIEKIIIIKMKMIFATIAMLLSTASARTLKNHRSCSEDYQPPNYWGRCVGGEYSLVDRDSGGQDLNCDFLVIIVPLDVVGNKTLTVNFDVQEGRIKRDLSLDIYDVGRYAVYSVIFEQGDFKGADVYITFYLDNILVHQGHYQQNFCFWEAGAITTNDPNAVTYEGSSGKGMPGHIIVTF